mgnify:CR=1 FL=1
MPSGHFPNSFCVRILRNVGKFELLNFVNFGDFPFEDSETLWTLALWLFCVTFFRTAVSQSVSAPVSE